MKPALIVALSSLALPSFAQEAPRSVAYAGFSSGEGSSAYAGAITALPGSNLGAGLAFRSTISGGNYRYQTAGTDIEADYYGLEVGLVQQWSGPWGRANVSIGPRFTQTDLSPQDPGNDRQGSRGDVAVGSDGARNIGDFQLGWFGSLGLFDESYQVQGRIGRLIVPQSGISAGLEVGLQGDPSYKNKSLGVFVSREFKTGWAAQASVGNSERDDGDRAAYLSVGVSRVF
ncbi:cellulose biosynthesis protein BcsS [Brevundimonas sp. DC300-4]|uniref:cellulose biosynthesis protein BcsS n=1 Tax=Brevundimonas sp. DC300-4 TaxID=2804594 RepID=UPI003CF75216